MDFYCESFFRKQNRKGDVIKMRPCGWKKEATGGQEMGRPLSESIRTEPFMKEETRSQ